MARDHYILLAVQQQVQGLAEERNVLIEKVNVLTAECAALRKQITGLVAERDELYLELDESKKHDIRSVVST